MGRATPLPLADKLLQDPNPSHWKVEGDLVQYYPSGKPLIGKGNPQTCSLQELRAAVTDPRAKCFFNTHFAPKEPLPISFAALFAADPDPSHWKVYTDSKEVTCIAYYANSRDLPRFGLGKPLYQLGIREAQEAIRSQARALMQESHHSLPLNEARQAWKRAEELTTTWNQMAPAWPTTPQTRKSEHEELFYSTWGALACTLEPPQAADVDLANCTCDLEGGELFLVVDDPIAQETDALLVGERRIIPLMSLIDHLEKAKATDKVKELTTYLEKQQEKALHPKTRNRLERALQRCHWILTPPSHLPPSEQPPKRITPPVNVQFSEKDQLTAATQETQLHKQFMERSRDPRVKNPGKIPELEKISPEEIPPPAPEEIHRASALKSLGIPGEHWSMQQGKIQYNDQTSCFTYSPEEVRDWLTLKLTNLNEELDEITMSLHQANAPGEQDVSGNVQQLVHNIQKSHEEAHRLILQFNQLTGRRYPLVTHPLEKTFQTLLVICTAEYNTFQRTADQKSKQDNLLVKEHRAIQLLLSTPLTYASLSWTSSTCRLNQDPYSASLHNVLSHIEHSYETVDQETKTLYRTQLETLKNLLENESSRRPTHSTYIAPHLTMCKTLLEKLEPLH